MPCFETPIHLYIANRFHWVNFGIYYTLLIFTGGKRSAKMEDYEEDPTETDIPLPEPKPLKRHPIPFDVNLHGH